MLFCLFGFEQVDELDYERRVNAYELLTEDFFLALESYEALPLVHQICFDVTSTEMGIRSAGAHATLLLVRAARTAYASADKTVLHLRNKEATGMEAENDDEDEEDDNDGDVAIQGASRTAAVTTTKATRLYEGLEGLVKTVE